MGCASTIYCNLHFTVIGDAYDRFFVKNAVPIMKGHAIGKYMISNSH